MWYKLAASLFFEKKKVEQNKNKTSKKNSHPDQFMLWQFAMAASCFGSAYCLHIGKNPVCVRSKKKRNTCMKKEEAHVVEIYLFLLNVFWAGVDIMIRCKQNGALNIRRETACTRGTRPDSAGRRKISRYIIVLMLLVDEWGAKPKTKLICIYFCYSFHASWMKN